MAVLSNIFGYSWSVNARSLIFDILFVASSAVDIAILSKAALNIAARRLIE